MNRILHPLLASMLVFGIAACSKQGPDSAAPAAASAPAAAADGQLTVGLAVSTLNNPSSCRCARAPKTKPKRTAST
jgi:ribose transport system substrate-binding protein